MFEAAPRTLARVSSVVDQAINITDHGSRLTIT
jgi:hypothetical protein